MSQPPDLLEPGNLPGEEHPPRHGFRGDRAAGRLRAEAPLGLSIAISREAGARGGTIGRLAGKLLNWQVYDQELLEFMAQDVTARQGLFDSLSPACAQWAEERLAELKRRHRFADDHPILGLARLALALAAQGEVVLIGRGTGCILPRATTLNVRIVSPLEERVAYMAQWMRLSPVEADEKVRSKDERRAEFLKTHFRRPPEELYQYDLVLNSSLLGEGACAELIARAAGLRWTPGDAEP